MPPTTSTQITIEKSPDYIIKPVAAIRLKKAIERCGRSRDIKFIVVLRDPFTRTVSEYLHWKLYLQSEGKNIRSFEKLAIKNSGHVDNLRAQVNTSAYSYHVQNWLKVFDLSQMCFVDGDRLAKNPYPVAKKLEKCLELEDFITQEHFYYNKAKRFYCPVDRKGNPKCLSSNKGRPHPKIDVDVEMKLRAFFKPYNKALYNVTGINFGWR
ncbi:heparan sulfate glucosamine 3-O-sulfotransferase 3B1-like isoform X2 [Dendronephthya gigantea]|nr:heparan sulfate glucosamine 3-O-sulfotransferase 3B1-like isoform X2 [Dendronephthya gigantea]